MGAAHSLSLFCWKNFTQSNMWEKEALFSRQGCQIVARFFNNLLFLLNFVIFSSSFPLVLYHNHRSLFPDPTLSSSHRKSCTSITRGRRARGKFKLEMSDAARALWRRWRPVSRCAKDWSGRERAFLRLPLGLVYKLRYSRAACDG